MPAPTVPPELPLNPRVFAILVALLDGPAHGYRIRQEVEARSEGAVRLDPGSLYRTIAKLVDDRWVEQVAAPAHEPVEDERRRYYGITPRGREVAGAEAARLRSLLARADRSGGLESTAGA